MRLVHCVLLVLLCPLVARAQVCGTAAYTYGHHVQNYAQAHAYHQNVVTLVPFAVKAVVSPDYYSSTQNDYRDKVLADAVAGKVFSLLLAQQAAAAQQAAPQPRTPQELQQEFERQSAQRVQQEELPYGLAGLIEQRCLMCHDGGQAKGDFDLSDPRALSRYDRGRAFASVECGAMPQKGGPLAPGDVAKFEQWWKNGKGKN